jgi:hypothetical protein
MALPPWRLLWQALSGLMALRWAVCACLDTEKNLRRIIGCREFWTSKPMLDEHGSWKEAKVA